MKDRPPHSSQGFAPPWSTRAEWLEANAAMAAALRNDSRRMDLLRDLSQQIGQRVNLLDPMLDGLCGDTCPNCTDNCCERATVWYDFKDLLGFHLSAAAVPAGQLPSMRKCSCKFLKTEGCALPRIERPFICTWFLCAAQKRALEEWPPSHRQFLENSLTALKYGRHRLEKLFLQEVAGR
jgi:hypothetical protein